MMKIQYLVLELIMLLCWLLYLQETKLVWKLMSQIQVHDLRKLGVTLDTLMVSLHNVT